MRSYWQKAYAGLIVLSFALVFAVVPVAAGDTILSNNSGVENAEFYVEGESSLVINGFDLTPLSLQLPVALDTVSISVHTAVPGASVDLVVYQDGNGGSPIDATLVHRQQVSVDAAGINRITLDNAAIITEPVVWVGFYLPVGFRFYADQSGSSVLTYWAWTAGGSFDLASLSSAAVLGPGDGSDPVAIAMGGIARITAELRSPQFEETSSSIPVGRQLVAQSPQDTSILQLYPACDTLLYDPEDITITAGSSFSLECAIAEEPSAPTAVAHPDGQILDLQRAGQLLKLSAQIPEDLRIAGAISTLPERVTHCFRIAPGDLEQAVIGEARGIPEKWHILPSVRFNDIVCAEVSVANFLSYFLPRTAESPPNVNLVVSWSRVIPLPVECGKRTAIHVPVVNTGQSWFDTVSGDVRISVENIHVASGVRTARIELHVGTDNFEPGRRRFFKIMPLYVTDYVNELHRLQVRVDYDNQIEEINEDDNTWFTEYTLVYPEGTDRCAVPPTPVPEE